MPLSVPLMDDTPPTSLIPDASTTPPKRIVREEPAAPKKKAPPTPPAHVAKELPGTEDGAADDAEPCVVEPSRALKLDEIDDVVVVTEPEPDLSGRTIKELRELCSQRGISNVGRKAELVERLRQS